MKNNNIILLTGTEEYLIQQKVNEYINCVKVPDLNLTIFDDIIDIPDERIINVCQQVPFGEDNESVVVVRGNLFKREHLLLQKYLSCPNVQCILIFITPLDKRKQFYKFLEKICFMQSFGKLDKNRFFRFTSDYFYSRGKQLDTSLVESIITQTKYLETEDSCLYEVVSEYDRLLCLVGNKDINLNDIKTIKPFLDLNVFKFISFLGKHQYTQALQFLQDLLNNSVNEFQLLSLLLRHYRILLKLHISSPDSIGISPYMMNEFQDYNKLPEKCILRCINLIISTQNNIKIGNTHSKQGIEELVVRLSLVGGDYSF